MAELKGYSLPGIQKKNNLIANDYYDFTIASLEKKLILITQQMEKIFDYNETLDEVGSYYLSGMEKRRLDNKIPIPKLLKGEQINNFEKTMISTMGPFWGAIGFSTEDKNKIFTLQNKLMDIKCDEKWLQSIILLEKYYESVEKYVCKVENET